MDSLMRQSAASLRKGKMQMSKTKDIREAVEAELIFDPLVDSGFWLGRASRAALAQ
jgi:hypothetical protein